MKEFANYLKEIDGNPRETLSNFGERFYIKDSDIVEKIARLLPENVLRKLLLNLVDAFECRYFYPDEFVGEESYAVASGWVDIGNPCIYRRGWEWKGAVARTLTQEEAQKMLDDNKQWSFGKGFYELTWNEFEGETVLEFNELSESDMW